jgi:dolichol kinase
VEGTLGGTLCVLVAWALIFWACGPRLGFTGPWPWINLLTATAASCLMEAVTTQLDNIFIPMHYFALLSA